jgi:exosortase family protein XrtM
MNEFAPQARFAAIFLATFGAFQLLYFAVPDSLLYGGFIRHGVTEISATILNALSSTDHVSVSENELISDRARLLIVRGCDGTAILFLLIASIVALRSSLAQKMQGIAVSILFVFLLNQVRIVSLFLILERDASWFHLAHIYSAPAILVVSSVWFFAWWATREPAGARA